METRDTPPAHLLTRIESFSLLSNHMPKYKSRIFEAGNYKWRLIIHIDGGDHIAAYVSMFKTTSLTLNWEVNAIFNIFLLNQNLDNYLCFQGKVRRFNAMNSKWGYSKLISKETLRNPCNGYLVDDNCVFGAEIFVNKRQQVIEHVSILQDTVPHKHYVTIPKFMEIKDIWISEEITAGGHKWKIEVYPNGYETAKDQSVSIYVRCVDAKSFASHQKVKASFTVCMKNKLHLPHQSSKASHWFTSSSTGWGWSDFIAIGDVRDLNRGFIFYDCCFLEFSISVQVKVV